MTSARVLETLGPSQMLQESKAAPASLSDIEGFGEGDHVPFPELRVEEEISRCSNNVILFNVVS